ADSERTCGRTRSADVLCWGARFGGNGDFVAKPMRVVGLSARRLSEGPGADCAITNEGQLVQFASGAPRPIDDLDHVARFAGSSARGCALLESGIVRCWRIAPDDNDSDSVTPTPRRVPNLNAVDAVMAGEHHACARSRDGTIRCWGWATGALGDGTTVADYV